jgi:hypothetical protein
MLQHMATAIRALTTRRVEFHGDRIPCRFAGVPWRKLLHWIRVAASMYVWPEKPWGTIDLCSAGTYAFEGGTCSNDNIPEACFYAMIGESENGRG